MKVEVQKTHAWHVSRIFRDDGVALMLRSPDRKFSPPHDVIHFAVEQALELHRGFWGTVAAGGKFRSMKVIDGRQAPHADARSRTLINANQPYLHEAELFVGVFQDVLLRPPKSYGKAIGIRVKEQGREIEPDDTESVWSSLVTLRKRWEALTIGQSLVLEWPTYPATDTQARIGLHTSAKSHEGASTLGPLVLRLPIRSRQTRPLLPGGPIGSPDGLTGGPAHCCHGILVDAVDSPVTAAHESL